MSRFDALFRLVANEQDAARARDALPERLASRFQQFSPRARRRVPIFIAAAAALCVVIAAAGFNALRQRPALTVAIGKSNAPLVGTWLGAPDARSLPLDFSDGSRFELTPKSRVRVAELGDSSARLELASGSLKVHVISGQAEAWRIDAGPFRVRITGTRFIVSYAPEADAFELSMEEGEVELSGCVFGEGRKLAVGQRVRASCRTEQLEVSYRDLSAAARTLAPTASSVESARAPEAEPSAAKAALERGAEVRHEAGAGSAPAPLATWFSLAKAGKYGEAYAAAERDGFEAECLRANAEALAVLADVARHARAPRKAEHALLTLRRRFPASPEAGLAAFSLGRLQFDEFRAYSNAGDWFRSYLKERPTGSMAREALGRLLEASYRAGEKASAEDAARRYLRDYPSGPHAELASRLVPRP